MDDITEPGTASAPDALAPGRPAEAQPWQRLPDHGRIAGVCAALSERYRVDVLLVRVAVAVLALSAGVGLALYVAAWLMVPAAGQSNSLLERHLPASREWSTQTKWVVTLVACTVVASPMIQAGLPLGPVILAGIVWWFVSTKTKVPAHTSSPGVGHADGHRAGMQAQPPYIAPRLDPNSEFGAAVASWQQRLDQIDQVSGATALPLAPMAHSGPSNSQTVAARRPEPSTSWGLVALLAAAVVGGAGYLLSPAGAHASVVALSLALAVLALALLIGAFTRRPRFVVLGAWALAISLAATFATARTTTMGVTQQRYTSVSELPSQLNFTASEGLVDFSELDAAGSHTVELTVSASNLTIIAPRTADVEVRYTLHASNLDLPGDESHSNRSGTVRIDQAGDDELVLVITAWASNVEVT